jgi:hypothetical protein
MRYFFILFLLFVGISASGQKIGSINFDQVKRIVSDTSSVYFYPKLIQLLNADSSKISADEYWYLYYGHVFQQNYYPYGNTDSKKAFLEYYAQLDQDSSKLDKAILLGKKVLKENPIDIEVQLKMYLCLSAANQPSAAREHAKHYYGFLDVIYASGDGKSVNSAFIVISVDDEYRIVGHIGLQVVEQSLINDCDVLTFSKRNQKRRYRIKKLYFNVRLPLLYLSRSFENSDLPDKE